MKFPLDGPVTSGQDRNQPKGDGPTKFENFMALVHFSEIHYPSIQGTECIDISQIKGFWLEEAGENFSIRLSFKNCEDKTNLIFKEKNDRVKAFNLLLESITTLNSSAKLMKNENMIKSIITDVKQFISDNRNIVYTIAAVILVDQFFLKGQLTEKVKSICEKVLSKIENKLA